MSEKVITCKNISFLFLIENVITAVRFTYIHFIGFFFFKLKKKGNYCCKIKLLRPERGWNVKFHPHLKITIMPGTGKKIKLKLKF